uniref:Uncharacterized protein n=1 Tax=Rhizophora mucronata TaxID=61149 RepID=A0A2P2PE65_RHIMU
MLFHFLMISVLISVVLHLISAIKELLILVALVICLSVLFWKYLVTP